MKAVTLVSCTIAFISCLTADWEHIYGPNHAFSGVKPAIRSFFNGIYGAHTLQGSGSGGDAGQSGHSSIPKK